MNTEIKTPHWRNVWRIKAFWRCFRKAFGRIASATMAGQRAAEEAHQNYHVTIPQLRVIAGHLRLIGMDAIPNNVWPPDETVDLSLFIALGIERFITEVEKEA